MTKLLSYHGDPLIKQKYVKRMAEHIAADELVQGQGFEDGRGCFVGCTLNEYDHSRFPIELGWPEWLAQLADSIFEGIPKLEAPQFATNILDAVPVGVDLEPVQTRFLLIIQRRNLVRIGSNDNPYAIKCREAIQQVIDLLEDKVRTEPAARAMSRAAELAERAAWAASMEAAEDAAKDAAWVAENAARSARLASMAAMAAWAASGSVEEAAESAAWARGDEARIKEYQIQRDELLKLLRECKDT